MKRKNKDKGGPQTGGAITDAKGQPTGAHVLPEAQIEGEVRSAVLAVSAATHPATEIGKAESVAIRLRKLLAKRQATEKDEGGRKQRPAPRESGATNEQGNEPRSSQAPSLNTPARIAAQPSAGYLHAPAHGAADAGQGSRGPATAPNRKFKPAPPAPGEVALGSGSAPGATVPADVQAQVARSVQMDAKPTGKVTYSKRFPWLKGLAFGGNANDLLIGRDDIPEVEREPLWKWWASRPELGDASGSLIWEHTYGLWRDELAGHVVYVPEHGCWWKREALEVSANSAVVRAVIGPAAKAGQAHPGAVDPQKPKGRQTSIKAAIRRTRRDSGMSGPVATIITTEHPGLWPHPRPGTQRWELWEFFGKHFGEEHAMRSLGVACDCYPVHSPTNALAHIYHLVITNRTEDGIDGKKHSHYTCHGLAIHLTSQIPAADDSKNTPNGGAVEPPKA